MLRKRSPELVAAFESAIASLVGEFLLRVSQQLLDELNASRPEVLTSLSKRSFSAEETKPVTEPTVGSGARRKQKDTKIGDESHERYRVCRSAHRYLRDRRGGRASFLKILRTLVFRPRCKLARWMKKAGQRARAAINSPRPTLSRLKCGIQGVVPTAVAGLLLARFQLFDEVESSRYDPTDPHDGHTFARSLKPLQQLMKAWSPLIDAGYVPFAEWG